MSILVNIHDIVAMGGIPLYAVNVVSFVDEGALEEMSTGIKDACRIYDVEIVNGHTHPYAQTNSIEVAMIGEVEKSCVIHSNTAKDGDYLIYAVDLDGRIHPRLEYNFDSTKKDAKILRRQMKAMVEVGKRRLVSSGKDVSNAGLIGTIGMMMEASKKGCVIELESIPKPENVDLLHWLKVYPATGFVVSSNEPEKVIKIFEKHHLTASVIGEVNSSQKVELTLNDEKRVIFNFKAEGILGT